MSQRNLVEIEASQEIFEPAAGETPVRMPGDTTTTVAPTAPGETVTTTTVPLVEPDAANFLVTGADNGACIDQDLTTIGDREGIGERSDTIMVWRVNPVANQLAVLSFPRDLWVDLPGGRKGRINEAYRRNDPSRLIDTCRSTSAYRSTTTSRSTSAPSVSSSTRSAASTFRSCTPHEIVGAVW